MPEMKLPGPDHPIAITPHTGRVVVRFGGEVIAETSRALSLKEASYPPVFYIPREDARMDLLSRTDHATYCPYKGECSYFSIRAGGQQAENAVWTYESAYPAVAEINTHLAFYPNKVAIEA
ncbi:DUF427 domain-containing protein [Siccirubricoccus sp. KC 17139]|uniref:DUF427 domain-containing protein n=1 Tax=Siccirubricoccus soli TaxID=2899147 RepID=A0ABT1D426_9PROT|nr:DUF427 domain-containing protein [Siccirubricoccus soli]MCO6416676.1 DUF427 domain-containing protein [Siccirubricoccus soli]MCP2682811.1 DUF427 domain-containing protein [Siccirubricoccus soli]